MRRDKLLKLLCCVFGHRWVKVSDTGIQPAKAGGCVGDSYLTGNEEQLLATGPLRLGEPFPVFDRKAVYLCSWCREKEERGRWRESADDPDLHGGYWK